MSPALPWLVSSPAPRLSSSTTDRPRACRCNAVDTPMIPAPSTTTSVCMRLTFLLVLNPAAHSGATTHCGQRRHPHGESTTPAAGARGRRIFRQGEKAAGHDTRPVGEQRGRARNVLQTILFKPLGLLGSQGTK